MACRTSNRFIRIHCGRTWCDGFSLVVVARCVPRDAWQRVSQASDGRPALQPAGLRAWPVCSDPAGRALRACVVRVGARTVAGRVGFRQTDTYC